jgi:hypothetical protein
MENSPLEWTLDPNPNRPSVEAWTLKWCYRVLDADVDDRWVAWRQFRHPSLNGSCLGELWVDTCLTFEAALAQAERWHVELDADHDLEWIHRESTYA